MTEHGFQAGGFISKAADDSVPALLDRGSVLTRSQVEMLGGLYVDYVPRLWREMPAGTTVGLVPATPKPHRLGRTTRYA